MPKWKYLDRTNKKMKSHIELCFLSAMQIVFLQKHHLKTAGLYDALALAGFSKDAVERWFTEKEVAEVVEFSKKMAV